MKKLNLIAILAVLTIAGLFFSTEGQVLQNVGGTTTLGGSSITGLGMTNGNVNAFVIFTNNGVSLSVNGSGVFTFTNYAAANTGFDWNTNGVVIIGGNLTNRGTITKLNEANGTSAITIGASGLSRIETSVGNMGFGNGNWLLDFQSAYLGSGTDNAHDLGASNRRWRNAYIGTALIMRTNYVAADFAPLSGHVKMVISNGVAYKVTQLSTNLWSQDIP